MLIFVPIPLFSNPLSPFMIVSNILNYRLPQNWALGAPKWVPKPPKRGKMTIYPKLKGLECSFLLLSHHFFTPPSPIIGYPQIWHQGHQNGSQNPPKGQNDHIFETKKTRVLFFVPIPPFSNTQSSFIIVSNIPNYRLPQNWALGPQNWPQTHPKLVKSPYFLN